MKEQLQKKGSNSLKETFPFMYEKQKRRESAMRQTKENMPDDFYAITFNEAPINKEVVEDIVEESDIKQSFKVKSSFKQQNSESRKSGGSFTSEVGKLFKRNSRSSIQSGNDIGSVSKHHHHHHNVLTGSGIAGSNPHGEEDFFQTEEFEFIQRIEMKQRHLKEGRFDVHGKTVYYSINSLFLMKTNSPIRKGMVWLIEWVQVLPVGVIISSILRYSLIINRWFDRFVFLAILLNSILLVLYDYTDRDSQFLKNKLIDTVAYLLTIIFLIEATIKIIAMGFIMHRFAYLRDLWNLMDFTIVIMGIVDLMSLGVNIKALRILRVLRPLRTLKAIPSMKRLVSTLLQSIPEVGNAGIFIGFMTTLFAILGLQQFLGVVYYRCRLTPKPINETYWPKSPIYTRVCSPEGNNGQYTCPEGLYCGSPIDYGISLEDDGVYSDPTIQYAIGQFDNFGQALLAVIQTITIEDWTILMYNISDGYTPIFTEIYFCSIVIIGHYYMLQLILGVIMQNLSKIQAQEAYEDIAKKRAIMEQDKIRRAQRNQGRLSRSIKDGASVDQGQQLPRQQENDLGNGVNVITQQEHQRFSNISKSTLPYTNLYSESGNNNGTRGTSVLNRSQHGHSPDFPRNRDSSGSYSAVPITNSVPTATSPRNASPTPLNNAIAVDKSPNKNQLIIPGNNLNTGSLKLVRKGTKKQSHGEKTSPSPRGGHKTPVAIGSILGQLEDQTHKAKKMLNSGSAEELQNNKPIVIPFNIPTKNAQIEAPQNKNEEPQNVGFGAIKDTIMKLREQARLQKEREAKLIQDLQPQNKDIELDRSYLDIDSSHTENDSIAEKQLENQFNEDGTKKNLDDRIKSTFMWSLGQQQPTQSKDLSKGLGLALISKILGIDKIEGQFQKFIDQLKKTLDVQDLDARLKMQRKICEDLEYVGHKMEFEVTKKYHMSKKSVYGIDNELHLVEQVQKSINIIINKDLLKQGKLTFFDGEQVERRRRTAYMRANSGDSQNEIQNEEPQLNEHMQVALKLAYNLRDLSVKHDVRKFFYSRFKKQLIKKNLIEKIHQKVEKRIKETEYFIRAKTAGKFVQVCFDLQSKVWFQMITSMAILANAIALTVSKYPIDYEVEQRVENLNLFFFGFFCLELSIKLIGRGFRFYFRDKFNWFDTAIVIISAIDIIVQNTLRASETGSAAITALRIFRLIRVFQLAKIWKDFNELLAGIQNTIKDISNMTILLSIFVLTYMLIGMELYAYRVKFNPETHELDLSSKGIYPRYNFNTPIEAFLSVFIVLANDGWTGIYFDYYRSTNSIGATVYFVSILILGQFMLLNLFIAIMIENFEQLSVRNNFSNQLKKINELTFYEKIINCINMCRNKKQVRPAMQKIDELTNDEHQEMLLLQDIKLQQTPSLFLFQFDSRIRRWAKRIIRHKWFEWIMLAIILISTVQLAIDNPLNDPNDQFSQILDRMEMALTAIFAVEALLKIIAHGFAFCGQKSYIRNAWNILDLMVLVISLMSYTVSSKNLNSIKAFRLMKVLRPLRVISRNQGLRISIRVMAVAMSSIINVIIVSLLFYCMFGIIGVNYFKGLYYDCDISHIYSGQQKSPFIDHKWDCINTGGEWIKIFMNFDNTLDAMSVLFIMSNTVMWSDVMYRGVSSRAIDYTPSLEVEYPFSSIYFVLIIVIGNFFLMNLFVGVIITTYNREKEILGKDFMLTEEQKKWRKKSMMILLAQPKFKMKIPHSDWRQPFYYIAQSPFSQYFITICILINTIILLLEWINQSIFMERAVEMINYIFAGIFTFEFLIKYIGFGNRYFKDPWNVFDVAIVVITLFSIILSRNSQYQLGPQTTVIRSFRIARVFYLFKRNRSLKSTFQTFMVTLPSMANIGSLLILIVLIYAILGVYLFAQVKLSGDLTDHANFRSVGTAFITLIRITTGESWPNLMEALSRDNDIRYKCITNPTYEDYVNNNYEPVGCGDSFFAIAYFFSYTLIICMIFLRLFIAIILQAFQEVAEKENKFMSTSITDRFRDVWSDFDPDATSFIKIATYPRFLIALGDPLGWDASYEYNYLKQLQYLDEINIPKHNRNNDYQFMDVLEHLILIMIIRREVIHFAIKNKQTNLLGAKPDFPPPSLSNSGRNEEDLDASFVIEEQKNHNQTESEEEEESDEEHESYPDSEESYKSNKDIKMAPFLKALKEAHDQSELQKTRNVDVHQPQIRTQPIQPNVGLHPLGLKIQPSQQHLLEQDEDIPEHLADHFNPFLSAPNEMPLTVDAKAKQGESFSNQNDFRYQSSSFGAQQPNGPNEVHLGTTGGTIHQRLTEEQKDELMVEEEIKNLDTYMKADHRKGTEKELLEEEYESEEYDEEIDLDDPFGDRHKKVKTIDDLLIPVINQSLEFQNQKHGAGTSKGEEEQYWDM